MSPTAHSMRPLQILLRKVRGANYNASPGSTITPQSKKVKRSTVDASTEVSINNDASLHVIGGVSVNVDLSHTADISPPPAKRTRSSTRTRQLQNETSGASSAMAMSNSNGTVSDEISVMKRSRVTRSHSRVIQQRNLSTNVDDTTNIIKTVTPVARKKKKKNSKDGINTNNELSIAKLPPGVVDIFPKTSCPSDYSTKNQTCDDEFRNFSDSYSMLPFLQYESFRQVILSSHHISRYGQDFIHYLRKKEATELDELVTYPEQSVRENQNRHRFGIHITSIENVKPSMLVINEEEDEPNDYDFDLDSHLEYRYITVSYAMSMGLFDETSLTTFDQILPYQPFLTVKMRRILVQWLTEVSEEFGLSEAAFHLSITLLDKILSRGPTRDKFYDIIHKRVKDDAGDEELQNKFVIQRNEFQALGCACIWIASKLEDKRPPDFEDMVYIADHSFTREKLLKIEARICSELEFRLHLVTPYHFVHVYLRASHACCAYKGFTHLDPSGPIHFMTFYLLELSRSSYFLSQRPPSLIAASCVYLARATLGICDSDTNDNSYSTENGKYWNKTLEYYTGYNTRDMIASIVTIHSFHVSAESSPMGTSSVYKKYKSEQLFGVSMKTARRIEDLGFGNRFHDMVTQCEKKLLDGAPPGECKSHQLFISAATSAKPNIKVVENTLQYVNIIYKNGVILWLPKINGLLSQP